MEESSIIMNFSIVKVSHNFLMPLPFPPPLLVSVRLVYGDILVPCNIIDMEKLFFE